MHPHPRTHPPRSPRALAALLALLLLPTLGAQAATAATTSQRAVNSLNQVRAKVGVPAVANDETLASGCQQHASWMQRTGRLSHFQTNGATPISHGEDAGRHSALAMSFELRPQRTQATIHWLRGMPLHLFQLLHPGLVRSGYAYAGSYACMYTLQPQLRGVVVHDSALGQGRFFTWPPAGARNVPVSENTATEEPNPNVGVGLPRSQTTGPWLIVYAGGFGNPADDPNPCNEVRFTSVRLTDDRGRAVKVRWIDDHKQRQINPGSVGPLQGCRPPSGGGIVAAERPLRPATTYTVRISALGLRAPAGTAPATHEWSFTTAGTVDRTRPVVKVTSARVRRAGSRFSWRYVLSVKDASPTTCTATVAGRSVRCRVVGRKTITIAGSRAGRPKVVPLRVVVRDASGNSRTVTRRTTLR